MNNDEELIKEVKPTQRFNLWIYVLIVFGLSWPFMFIPLVKAINGVKLSQLESQAWSGIMMWMVTVGSFICGRWIFRDGFRTIGWRWGSWRSWGLAFGLALLVWGTPMLASTLIDGIPADFKWAAFWSTLAYIFVDCVFGFGEEFGWRGYLLPRLWWLGPRRAVMANAVIWWIWHIPTVELGFFLLAPIIAAKLNLSVGTYLQTVALPQIAITFLSAIFAGVIFCYIWIRSGSIVVASVFHGLWGTIRNLSTLWTGNVLTSYLPIVLIIIIGLLLIWRGQWILPEEKGLCKRELPQ
jgi:membrane protease YdiL (CAAX protease family)